MNMKQVWAIIGLSLIAGGQLMAADQISETFQKGLFEEEANHDLQAAIKAYQSTIDQTAEHRKIAAAALFRLGECYRKLNKTNEAVAQYRRLIREFADQPELATLGKQTLASLGEAVEVGPITIQPAEDLELKEINRLKVLAKENPDLLHAKDEQGETPLHRAARRGFLRAAEFLLAHKADVNALNTWQGTPLHYAVFSGETKMVELLLRNGANVNALGSIEYETASKTNTLFGGRPLHVAAFRGNNAIAELLLRHKADVNGATSGGRTPLYSAIEQGFLGFVRLLLARGADVNRSDAYGETPAMRAAALGHENIVRLLLESGADLDAQTQYGGHTLLHYAVGQGSAGVLKAVLERKPNLESTNVLHETPLMAAARSRYPHQFELLLQAGANPNFRNATGSFPLFAAVEASNTEAIRLLLSYKADPNQVNAEGFTALNHAVIRNQDPPYSTGKTMNEIIDLLWQAGGQGDRTASIGIARDERQIVHGKFLRQDPRQLNRFTLFEVLCFIYDPPPDRWLAHFSSAKAALRFPDFGKIRIDRLVNGGKERRKIELNLETALASGDCSKDVPLEWGDIVEIPEKDHPANAFESAFPDKRRQTLGKCLARDITVTARGKTTPVHLHLAQIPPLRPGAPGESATSFRLKEVVSQFTLYFHIPIDPQQVLERVRKGLGLVPQGLRDLVDLKQVVVVRKSPETGEDWKVIFDAEGYSDIDDLYLRNGDAIYLPDKQ
jgi:ankyrin repeat protein